MTWMTHHYSLMPYFPSQSLAKDQSPIPETNAATPELLQLEQRLASVLLKVAAICSFLGVVIALIMLAR